MQFKMPLPRLDSMAGGARFVRKFPLRRGSRVAGRESWLLTSDLSRGGIRTATGCRSLPSPRACGPGAALHGRNASPILPQTMGHPFTASTPAAVNATI